ncbi:MAG: PAS domain S-box protein [Gemmataceae bacterium]
MKRTWVDQMTTDSPVSNFGVDDFFSSASSTDPSAFYQWSTTTNQMVWGGHSSTFLGYKSQQMPTCRDAWLALVHPEDIAQLQEVYNTNGQVQSELVYRVRRADGQYVPIQDQAGLVSESFWLGRIFAPQQSSVDDPFRQIVQCTPLGILVANECGDIVFANPRAQELFGYSLSEFLDLTVESLLPESQREAHREHRRRYTENPEPRMMADREFLALRRDGNEIPVAVGLNPLTLGSKSFITMSLLDLWENKRAQQELANFFRLSPDLLCIASFDGHFRRINQSFERVLGYTQQELLAKPFVDFVHPDDKESTYAEVEKLRQGKPTIRFWNRYRDTDGRHHWFEWNAMAMVSDGLIFAVARDITERINIRDQLQARVEREQAILDNTSAVIYVKGADGKYQFVNTAFSDLFSVSLMDTIGKTDHDLFEAEVAETFSANDAQVVRTKKRLQVDEIAPHDDGPHSYISVKVPLFDANGKVTAVAGISTDITDRLKIQKTEHELRMAHHVQQRLYPTKPPELSGYSIAGASHPMSELCGDYFDYIVLSGGDRIVLTVGDVSGHGLGPALQMVEIRALIRMLLNQGNDMVTTLELVNQMIVQDEVESSFITLFMAELNGKEGCFNYVGAGHDAWVVRDGQEVQRLDSTGFPLGIMEVGGFEQISSIPLASGDVLMMYTDGVTEAACPKQQLFGCERALDVVHEHRKGSASTIVETLYARVLAFAGDQPLTDDLTAIVVKAD